MTAIEPMPADLYKHTLVTAALLEGCFHPANHGGYPLVIPVLIRKERAMKSRLEMNDDVVGSSVAATVVDAVRHAVFAGAVALPMAMLAVMDGFESESDYASAGELWLEVQNKLQGAAERNL